MKPNAFMRFGIWTTLAAFCATNVYAGNVDLASAPMVSGLSKVVSPNIFLVLDDSGSMAWDYLPDTVNNDNSKACFKNFGYNKVYYNPAISYVPPKKADGTSYAASTFTAAPDDGFVAGSTTRDLSATTTTTQTVTVSAALGNNPFATTNGSSTVTVTHAGHGLTTGTNVTFGSVSPSPRFNNVNINGRTYPITVVNSDSYTFPGNRMANATGTGGGNSATASHDTTQNVTTPDYYYQVYTANPTSPSTTCAADSAYTRTVPSTAAEKTNFANWYSYYRTRILMMKSALGRAFAGIDDKYRVGLTMISESGTNSAKFLNIAKFNAAQKTSWYTMLYGVNPTSSTPLRSALSKAGRLYAGKLVPGNNDPVQYSCQQNFTIMTTDGYWNTGNESIGSNAATNYGPYKEDNLTLVGDQDGVAGTQPPYLDTTAPVVSHPPNSLADIAMYYYKTDLRTTSLPKGGLLDDGVTRLDVSTNNVPTGGSDAANWQHMTTFTLGLGVSGLLAYDPNYLTGGSTVYTNILQGNTKWPDPLTSSTSTSVVSRIDDLWHAAVNGHGQYLSAGDPDSVVSALNKTLAAISKTTGSSAAAATSSLEPVAGDNFAYVAQYTTALWYGDVQAKTIDLITGAISATSAWSARDQLVAKVGATSDSRAIYTFSSGAANKLRAFTPANLATEIAAGYFKSYAVGGNHAKLTQYDGWNSTEQTAATDDAMIAYLRGQTGNQDSASNTVRLFRDRSYALGDVVNGAPVFVKKPPFKYGDAGYTAFASANATRAGTVYVGANDGMLHAFDADTGNERWAYIPTAVIPNLYKLADAAYANNHRFYVDGAVTAGDAYDGSNWRTVLIGGLGGGGKGFYALDVTDPANPRALWEFGTSQDDDIGYSYGNPILTKRASDGRWVVLFASSYNNTTGDSKGRLYVVDAFTGAKLSEIITDNSVNDPDRSGIAKVTNWVLDTLIDNSTRYVYGGDLGGSLWRFDINAGVSQRLGETSATPGNQPITVRPEVARIRDSNGTYQRVVYFGTGRYLGFNDLSASSTSATIAQAVYAVKDTGADLGVLTTAGANLVMQTVDTAVTPRTIPSPLPVDWVSKNGWYLPLPVGERVNVDLKLQLGTLVFLSNVPKDDYCTVGGSSWIYALDYQTGAAVTGQSGKYVGFPVGSSIGTGLTLVRLPTGKLVAIVTESDTTLQAVSVPTSPAGGNSIRRVGWREIN